ncbi:DUF498-domain-containing protein [Tricholoma matsutake]|nr:DUF498-domain-containing protein [Tricholoma matsutake 945]
MSSRFLLSHPLRYATRRPPLRAFSLLALRPLIASTQSRGIRASPARHDSSFTNILADVNSPAVQVKSITSEGIQLLDGLLISSACIFLEGQVFLWSVPSSLWDGWGKEHLEIFDTVLPKPEILLLGTGKTTIQAPPWLRTYMNQLGIQVDVMDTRNACSTYNLLAEEGRRVAAALLPLTSRPWQKAKRPRN